LTKWGYPLKYF